MAENYGAPPVHGPQQERLAAFVGRWHAEGLSFGRNQDRAEPRRNSEAWVSEEVTHWHAGNFFVIQEETARTGDEPLITHSVIGVDAGSGEFFATTVENHGHSRRYAVTNDGPKWTFLGDTERARIEFSDDGRTQNVAWEWRPSGDEWLPLCERTNRRAELT